MGQFLSVVRPFEEKPAATVDEYSPVSVYVREESGYLHLMLEIEDGTTVQDLRDTAPLALALRDRLLEFQGPWVSGGDTRFYEDLCLEKEAGASWASLTDRINASVASHLADWNRYVAEYRRASPSFKTWGDFYSWKAKQTSSSSLDHAKDLLRLMKLTDSEIDTICREGLERIARGEEPFEKGYPIDTAELRTTVRSWQLGKMHRYHTQVEQRAIAEHFGGDTAT